MSNETPLGMRVGRLAQADPERPAITCGADRVSRADLELRTNRLARAYSALGVTRDSFVTIGLPNGIEFYEATIAAWKLGATPQPISSRLPAAERRAIIDLADPSLVVGVEPSEAPGRAAVPAGFEPNASLSAGPLPPVVAASFKAPTSGGSTGRPKLIVATQAGVWEELEGFAALFRIPSDGVHLVTGPLYHNGPFSTSLLALLSGDHVVVMPRFDAMTALALVAEHRVDWMYAVPTMMHRIWRLPEAERARFDVSSLQVVYHMAAPCPGWLKQAWIDWLGGERVLELYGGTEAQAITVISGTEWLEHRGSVGRPVVGEIRILDTEGRELPPGKVGEVWMRRGADAPPTYRYVGAKPRSMAGNWESLGDMGWQDEDGYLYLSDRDTDMILVGGSNVYPAEVESALDEHALVASSCVIGLPDEEYGSVVHAIVQATAPLTAAELDEFLRARLVTYKRPRTYEFVARPLRGDDGKVRRSALRAERVGKGVR
ncbi:MAG TPA: AMP-binding protein [Candidatus Methylomirabilis sp.]|nr:AMP-binding protein [Candidatus Methylomirabilis sp.]